MVKKVFHIKPLLEILFKILKKSTNYFADAYLLKDVSLVSKWKTGKVIPKNADIDKIVEFVNNESTGMQRHLIRIKVEEYINESLLDISLKNMLLDIEDFSIFLTETIIVSVSDTDTDIDTDIDIDIDTDIDIHADTNNITSTLENTEVNEEIVHSEETKTINIPSSSHGIQGYCKHFPIRFHKSRAKITVFVIMALFITIFTLQQFISYNDPNSVVYTGNYSLPNSPNTMTLSDKYLISYTHMKETEDEIQVDINGIPIMFNTESPKLINNVLYLPIGETLKGLGFSYVGFNGRTQTFKDLRTGIIVIANVNTEKLQIGDKLVRLSDKIKMVDSDIYIPAYSLKGFITYLDRFIPQSIDIYVDNKIQPKYQFEPRIVDDVLYLPFRYIFELFDYNVKPDRRAQEGAERAIAQKDTKTVEVEECKEFAKVSEKMIPIGSAVFMSSNTTYVPVDIIKQVLNMDYYWNKDKKTLEITTGK